MLAALAIFLLCTLLIDNFLSPLAVWDVAEARTEEIFLGIAVAAVVGAMCTSLITLLPVFLRVISSLTG